MMFERRMVQAQYLIAVKEKDGKGLDPMLIQTLMDTTNPRIKTFINNVTDEINKVGKLRRRKGKGTTLPQAIYLVRQMTDVLIVAMISAAQQAYMSDIKKLEIQTAVQKQKDLDSTVEGKPAGIFEEMGVITDEKIIGSRDQSFEEKKIIKG